MNRGSTDTGSRIWPSWPSMTWVWPKTLVTAAVAAAHGQVMTAGGQSSPWNASRWSQSTSRGPRPARSTSNACRVGWPQVPTRVTVRVPMTKRHSWFAVLFHTRPPVGPQMMARLEFMLAVLTAQGASTAAAMTYAALIDRHIVGSGLQEAEEARMSRRHGLDDDASLAATLAAVRDLAAAGGRYPLLTSWLAEPAGPSADEQFHLGLGFLLDGIAAQLPSSTGPAG